jgi:ferric-dicitrate binding protein FerR (iron transport regulator)
MTKRNRSAASSVSTTSSRDTETPASERQFEPRPFQRRPWLLAASALALVAWMFFLLVMAWQPWEAKKRPPPLREKEAAHEATDRK